MDDLRFLEQRDLHYLHQQNNHEANGQLYRIATKSGGLKAPAWFTIQIPDIIIYSYPLANAAQA